MRGAAPASGPMAGIARGPFWFSLFLILFSIPTGIAELPWSMTSIPICYTITILIFNYFLILISIPHRDHREDARSAASIWADDRYHTMPILIYYYFLILISFSPSVPVMVCEHQRHLIQRSVTLCHISYAFWFFIIFQYHFFIWPVAIMAHRSPISTHAQRLEYVHPMITSFLFFIIF